MFLLSTPGVSGRTPNRSWLTVETGGSRMMTPAPKQRLKIRTPSYLAPQPHTPYNPGLRLSVSALTPRGLSGRRMSCHTPSPVYQIPCRSYFQGECINAHCLDSHDPSLVAKCRFFINKQCNDDDKCEFRHDRPELQDQRSRFNIEKYRDHEFEKTEKLRKQIKDEQMINREEKADIYTKKVYTDHIDLGESRQELCYQHALEKIAELKISYSECEEKSVEEIPKAPVAPVFINVIASSPGGTTEEVCGEPEVSNESPLPQNYSYLSTDYDGYFDEILEWLSEYDLSKWTAKQMYNFYTDARFEQAITSPNSLDLLNTIFFISKPDHKAWATFINLMGLETARISNLMYKWMQFDDITELHVGGLYSGLMQIEHSKWNLEKMSKLLIQTINQQQYTSTGIVCSNLSSVLSDGCFILGMAQYLDIEIMSKLIKFYLLSKQVKYEGECTCYTFHCHCPSFIEWDIYGLHTFRPLFDYSGWSLSKKAELFGKASEELWIEDEITAILDQILEGDSCEEDKNEVLKFCKTKETTEHIMRHYKLSNSEDALQELANMSIKSADDSVLVDMPESKTGQLSVCQNIKVDVLEQCTNAGTVRCIHGMCGDCCLSNVTEKEKCSAHTTSRLGTVGSFSDMTALNEFNKLICTEEDEHWDFVTFGSIEPAMTFDDFKDFENYIKNDEVATVKLKKIEFTSGTGLTDAHVVTLVSMFGESLQVFEILNEKSGDICGIRDQCIFSLANACKQLLKLRLVSCTQLSNKAFHSIIQHCTKLQSLELSGAVKFSGFLTDLCLQPLFDDNTHNLCLLNLLDQYFINTATVERLRRYTEGTLKVIIGEREEEEGDEVTHGRLITRSSSTPFTAPRI